MANATEIRRLMVEENAYFYVCGDISMAYDVAETLCKIIPETDVNGKCNSII